MFSKRTKLIKSHKRQPQEPDFNEIVLRFFEGDGATLIANVIQMKMLSFSKSSQVRNQKVAHSAMSPMA